MTLLSPQAPPKPTLPHLAKTGLPSAHTLPLATGKKMAGDQARSRLFYVQAVRLHIK